MTRLAQIACLLTVLAPGWAFAEARPKCVDLKPDHSGRATVTEPVPEYWPLCFKIDTVPGRLVTVSITKSDEMRFSVLETKPDWQDERALVSSRQDFDLRATAPTYNVLVDSRQKPANTTAAFTLSIKWE